MCHTKPGYTVMGSLLCTAPDVRRQSAFGLVEGT